MMWMRDPKFYREIQKIPNVRLIDPTIDSLDLMRDARVVTAVTSTIGLEAALMGKPVITFGSVFYNVLPSVHRCTEMDSLPMMIVDALAAPAPSEEPFIDLISAVLEESIDINMFKDAWLNHPDVEALTKDPDLRTLADAIIEFSKQGALI